MASLLRDDDQGESASDQAHVGDGDPSFDDAGCATDEGGEDCKGQGPVMDTCVHDDLRWFGGTGCLTGLTGFETPHNPDTLGCAEETGHQRPDQLKAAKTLRRCAGVSFSIALIILATGSTSALKLSVSVLK
jgi:hypothetical protein